MHIGLRPRLKSRPSLLDLIQKTEADAQSSQSLEPAFPSASALADKVEPSRIPLPPSPLISPQGELPSQPPPPRITLHEASDTDEEELKKVKMPPVSILEVDTAMRLGS